MAGDGAGLEEHWRKLERMYASAPVNRFYEPVLSVGTDRAEIVMDARPEFHHAAGALHGSVYFKMLDDSAFFAANSGVVDCFLLTVSFQLDLVRPVIEGRIRAVGRVVHRARKLVLAESELTGEGGGLLARGSGSFMPSRVRLGPEIGYV